MHDDWKQEIEALHRFFAGWFRGELPPTDAAFSRFSTVTGADFVIITPDGRLIERAELLPSLRAAHGSRPDLRIWIERATLRRQHGDMRIATYEEWQRQGECVNARLSTVIFQKQAGVANGLIWLHVHETWLASQGRVIKPEH
jgi:hypothetical protein